MSLPPHRHALARWRPTWLLLPVVLVALVFVSPAHAWAQPDGDDDGADAGTENDATTEDDGQSAPFFLDTAGWEHDEAIVALAQEGHLQGCEEERFCPDHDLTRGQMATILTNALGLEPIADGPFDDIAGNIHEQRINSLAAAGITAGCGGNGFCPDDAVTREQMATMLVRAFEIPPTDTQHFDDLSQDHGGNVNALAEAGITGGCSDRLTDFCSTEPLLRWQAATLLARTLGLVDRVELAPLEERRAEQERIDAEREAQRQAEEEARRAAEREAEEAAERLAMWEALAECESNGNWSANTGNGFYGGLQFLLQTWRSVGGQGMPHQASKEEQIYRAERLLEKPWATFANQWPACSRRLGLS
jgi:hypothetical protein